MSTIYCDESGFSGPNLYHDDAPYFVYAGVAVEPPDAAAAVERIKSFFRHFQGEIKFAKLIQSPEGRAALDWLLTEHGHRAKIWYANKKFATAGKFFEYVFEPVLSDNSRLFYRKSFHRYVANVLFAGMRDFDRHADELLADLQKMIRNRDAAGLNRLFSPPADLPSDAASVFDDISAFALGYRDRILKEVDTLSAIGDEGVWTMDLTLTALAMVARSFALDTPELTLVCDDSKPLKVSREVAEAIIQADFTSVDKGLGVVAGAKAKLAAPLALVRSSASTPGIQLADLFAGMVRMMLTSPNEEPAPSWKARLWPLILAASVEAELAHIDLDQPEVFANTMVLQHLAERARNAADPLRGMDSFFEYAIRFARIVLAE